jgi:superfamily II DNA or RNA helicase
MYVATSVAETAKARKDLRVVPLQANAPFPRAYKMYDDARVRGAVRVPLFWAMDALGVVPTPKALGPRLPGLASVFAATLRHPLRQPEASDKVVNALSTIGGAVLQLPTGYGKTTVGLHVAHRLGVKTLVLVHKQFLADQWAERVAQVLPNASISKIQGDVCDISGDVVIAMIQTLLSRKYNLDVFGFLIVDEVHHIAAEAFSKVMFATENIQRRLGLSATPVRKDGLTKVIHWFFGPTAFGLERTAAGNVRVQIVKYAPPTPLDMPLNRRGEVCYATLMTTLTLDEERTKLIVDGTAKLFERGRHVLVLSHRRDHCKAICALLIERNVEAQTYLGGDKSVPESRVLVSTFALTSEGFDCPRLNALVLATPASDVAQSVGRILRGGDSTNVHPLRHHPLIVDIIDNFPISYAQASKRRGLYRKSGFGFGGDALTDEEMHAPPPSDHPMFVEDG